MMKRLAMGSVPGVPRDRRRGDRGHCFAFVGRGPCKYLIICRIGIVVAKMAYLSHFETCDSEDYAAARNEMNMEIVEGLVRSEQEGRSSTSVRTSKE